MIEDIVKISESAKEEENKRLNIERKKETAEIVRKISMERLAQTRERRF